MVLPLNTSKIAFFYLTIGMFEVRKWSASSIFSNISKKKGTIIRSYEIQPNLL